MHGTLKAIEKITPVVTTDSSVGVPGTITVVHTCITAPLQYNRGANNDGHKNTGHEID